MKRFFLTLISFALVGFPMGVFGAPDLLEHIYESRRDLQFVFDESEEHLPRTPGGAGFLMDLKDWAYQYGWQTYPELSAYAPRVLPPTRLTGSSEAPNVAEKYIVLDRASGQVLAQKHASDTWPIASIAKLVTTDLIYSQGVDLESVHEILSEDDVGGAKLYVNSGDTFRVRDLFYATLVGSANNAANALARLGGGSKDQFVNRMNAWAKEHRLRQTHFADPTGIEVENVSTAREVSRLAQVVFDKSDLRRFSGTAARSITVLPSAATKYLKNTNQMLYAPAYDDVFIMSSKTGYLEESKWNLVVSIRPELTNPTRELLIVTFGSGSRQESFENTRDLARWAWQVHQWDQK